MYAVTGYRPADTAIVTVPPSHFLQGSFVLADAAASEYGASYDVAQVAAAGAESMPMFDDVVSVPADTVLLSDTGGVFGTGTTVAGTVSYTTVKKNYVVKKKDTIATIAKTFGISIDSIYTSNPTLRAKGLKSGKSIVLLVPTVVQNSLVSDEAALYRGLPIIRGYFGKPVDGITNGAITTYNSVNFVAACGSHVLAAASGVVIPDQTLSGVDSWNNGYGTYVYIEHGNGTKTRYAHLGTATVSAGDIIQKGQEIGVVGKTGDVSSCQLGFEVYGARNPFGKY